MIKLAAAGLLMLTALPASAQSNAQPYRASGTEPFWSLTIDGSTIRYQPAAGRVVSVARPRPTIGFNGENYRTRRLTVDITHVECSDGMSDRTYHDTVTINVGGRTLRGCGGEILSERPAQASLLEGSWRIESIGGRPVAPRTTPRVTFSGDRISGNASCNNFNGSFRFERGRLTAGRLASTRMACMQRAENVQESAVLRILGEPLSVSRNRAGKLVLTSTGGSRLVLAPERRR
ncbi:META domain-containing protein [Sphingomonas gei]|uniref:META domain-containing protein n=1 Tax=Sphingomonas gei TaxID=1395960 RepID=A0A4S1XGY2_9SPHN|nr:META domain-containing protein [Sphingomonas gei]TGX55884.1 META domain-containing protein [Sphingomonas gei]